MTEDQKLWIIAAKEVGCDPESHEDDEIIQPVFDKLKRALANSQGEGDDNRS